MPMTWAERYATGDTPWDLGGPHPELARRLASGELDPARSVGRRALVAGCGRGYDAVALARAGWKVTAIDGVAELAPALAPLLRSLGGELLVADALAYTPEQPFDLVFDHTFFCAIDVAQRDAHGALTQRALRVGGLCAALVFPVGKPHSEGGPPFGFDARDFSRALGADFELLQDDPVTSSAPGRPWPERWALWRRRH
jgi:SAM-dependent methyltransferase